MDFFLFQSSRPGGRDEPRAAAPPSLCGLLGGARAAVAVGPASWGKKAARHAFFVRLYTVVGLVISIFQVATRFNQSTSSLVLIRVYPRFGKFYLDTWSVIVDYLLSSFISHGSKCSRLQREKTEKTRAETI